MKNPEPTFNFETKLNELNKLVETIEKGGISLEQSLRDFERGIGLIRECQEALNSAEQKVQILLGQEQNAPLTDFVAAQEE
ncbi:MAG: exodeoxyribonuclease VII small subunit [Gammaproteobacteria bacterium]